MPENFSKVTDYLYRGGEPTPSDIRMLKNKYNVKKIISLDSEIGDDIHEICKILNIKHIIFPLTDGTDPSNLILKEYILPLIENGGPTYIHCKHGKDRTSMAVAMFRVLKGWPVEKALDEAASFKMGEGLDTKQTYYDAVKELKNDENSLDVVEIQRDTFDGNPGINDQTVDNFNQSSFAPFLDAETDHLNRSAATKIYRYCNPGEVLKSKQYWFYDINYAKHNKKPGERLYSAILTSDGKIYEYNEANKQNVYYAMVNDADIILFDNYVLILSPNAIIDISDESDINDLQVGLHDNYTGMAPYFAPGSGGFLDSGQGGFAGPVFLPSNGLNL